MTLKELATYNPDLLAEIQAGGASDERERQRMLDAMLIPGVNDHLIEKARRDGSDPTDIALESLNVLKDSQESNARLSALQRDSAPLNKVKAGDAPFKFGKGRPPILNANGRKSR
jgi:hypothetical protein